MTNRRGNHEGSIRKLPSGSFRVQVTINGKRISFSAPTRKEVQDWLQQINLECTEIAKFPMKDLTLEEYLDNWLLVKKTTIRHATHCLLYTSDAADDLLCVDLGGRRIIKKKKKHI